MEPLGMKNCKECGKLFTPKSRNSVYCDDLHYRPCPVCGKPVEAKYLSDPARCCSNECKNQARKMNTSPAKKPTMMPISSATKNGTKSLFVLDASVVTNTTSDSTSSYRPTIAKLKQSGPDSDFATMLRESSQVMTYVNPKSILGFIPGHEYALEISKDDRNILYIIEALYDFTDGKEVSHCMNVASQISITQNFAKL